MALGDKFTALPPLVPHAYPTYTTYHTSPVFSTCETCKAQVLVTDQIQHSQWHQGITSWLDVLQKTTLGHTVDLIEVKKVLFNSGDQDVDLDEDVPESPEPF
jgi:hypothetical protein